MKWATIIIAALVCGCGKLYTEHDMQEAARKAAMEAVDDAEIKSWNCMSCGCQLIHWYTMGGGGDPDVQAAQREIDGILDECRTRINEANRRCRAKILNKCPNAEEMSPAYLRPYIPNELMNAEKTRAKCASWTNWTNRIKWHLKHTYCNGNPYRDNVEISPKEEN